MQTYATDTEADAYMEGRLNTTAWDNATTADKIAALTMATRVINNLAFAGYKSDPDQELEFPRIINEVEMEDIPQKVKDCCAEEALSLLSGNDPHEMMSNLNVTSEGIATIRATYDPDADMIWVKLGFTSKLAFNFIYPYLRNIYASSVDRG